MSRFKRVDVGRSIFPTQSRRIPKNMDVIAVRAHVARRQLTEVCWRPARRTSRCCRGHLQSAPCAPSESRQIALR